TVTAEMNDRFGFRYLNARKREKGNFIVSPSQLDRGFCQTPPIKQRFPRTGNLSPPFDSLKMAVDKTQGIFNITHLL
ncbi:MAG: hypothetical protein U9P12_08690, partial [Verrucomicrobiota bacterium]|nr:hypothetical protein [Verrucomicrobiota bacterium]